MSNDVSIEELVAAAQADPDNNSAAMTTLLQKFERLARKIGFELARAEHLRDDASNGARWGLIQAVRRHKVGTPGFASFADIVMRQEALRWLRRDDPSEATSRYLTEDDADLPAPDATVDTVVDIEAALTILKKDQKVLLLKRYVEDLPLGAIASESGVTVSAVSQRLSTIHRRLEHHSTIWMDAQAA